MHTTHGLNETYYSAGTKHGMHAYPLEVLQTLWSAVKNYLKWAQCTTQETIRRAKMKTHAIKHFWRCYAPSMGW